MNFSIVIVTYKSDHLIEDLIKSIPNSTEILIVENSQNLKLKLNLEKNYTNTSVIIPSENLGYAKALNYGVKKSKNNFVLCLVADVFFEKQIFIKISELINEFKDFAVLAPTYKDEKIYKNYWLTEDGAKNIFNVKNNKLFEVKDVDGAAFLVNKKKFEKNIMDENFFLYFENTDMCLNIRKKGHKVFAIENLKFIHSGMKSSDKKFEFEINKSRNWHYCWSKFYFYRKNFSYLYALKRILPNIYRSITTVLRSIIKKDKISYELGKAELSGVLNSLLLKESAYRPKIN